VGNEEVLRFDCHDALGHWHGGGYDRLERPRDSHRDFPEGVQRVADQVDWALQQIEQKGHELLREAAHGEAAQTLEPAMVRSAVEAIRSHLGQEGDLRAKAIAENLIAT
jgi:hypothetical protein